MKSILFFVLTLLVVNVHARIGYSYKEMRSKYGYPTKPRPSAKNQVMEFVKVIGKERWSIMARFDDSEKVAAISYAKISKRRKKITALTVSDAEGLLSINSKKSWKSGTSTKVVGYRSFSTYNGSFNATTIGTHSKYASYYTTHGSISGTSATKTTEITKTVTYWYNSAGDAAVLDNGILIIYMSPDSSEEKAGKKKEFSRNF